MSLTVLSPGLHTLPVDLGRVGRRALGVPVGGAADRAALMLGNGLVGNAPTATGLEITLAGPTLRAEAPVAAVLFGAAFTLTRNGDPLAPGATFRLSPGDILKVGGTSAGCRAYLCIGGGGFDPPRVPEPLTAGAVLRCGPSAMGGRSLGFIRLAPTPRPPLRGGEGAGECDLLRVLPGPQRDWFPDDSFFARPFTVSPASNRMGVRLLGEPIPKRSGELVSEPVAPGAVQVTNDGLPIVLGVDGQTIGGYPKIAHVIRADLDKLGQLRPGDGVQFALISEADADVVARRKERELRHLLLRLEVTACRNRTH
jgi:antagonist of KipI